MVDRPLQGGAPILVVRYLIKELLPQFFSALIVICAIVVVSQLVRLSDVLITFGLSPENVFLPFLYIMLPFVSLTIPVAFLFAVLLSLGRLSADGEYTALLAAGYSLKRAAAPILMIALVLYGIAAVSALNLEPWGRRELVQFFYRKTQTELDNMLRHKMQAGVFMDDFLGYVLYAEEISPDRTSYKNVLLAPGNGKDKGNFTVLAPKGGISGTVKSGNLRLTLERGVSYATRPDTDKTTVLKFRRAEIDLLRIFRQKILGADSADDDYRSYGPARLWDHVEELEGAKGEEKRDEYLRARFLLHKRIGAPFATVTFAFFGMVLAISDPRRGKSKAYIGAIVTIIGGYVLTMGFGALSRAGHLPAPIAAWLPNVMLLLFGGFLVYQKNRLPPSEGTLDPHNVPLVRRLFTRRQKPPGGKKRT